MKVRTQCPRAYVIARVDITDPEAYGGLCGGSDGGSEEVGRSPARARRPYEALEGQARARNVVVEFDSFDDARSYYFSELYQTAKTKREGAAIAEFVLVEGV